MKFRKSKQVITIEPRLFVDGEMYQINDIVEVTRVDGKKVLGRISDIMDNTYGIFCGPIYKYIKIDSSEQYEAEDEMIFIKDIVQIKSVGSVKV